MDKVNRSEEGSAKSKLDSKLDDLNRDVSLAIDLAQGLEAVNSEYTATAFALVSLAEQRLACEVEYAGVEWTIAWRGAIRAAVKSGDTERARNLIEHLKVNFQIDPEFVGELEALLS